MPTTTEKTTIHRVIVGKTEYSVSIGECYSTVSEKSVNPATGKGWQAARNLVNFFDTCHAARGMREWLYRIERARRGNKK